MKSKTLRTEMLPPIDVTICTLNSEHSIRQCIESVLREVNVHSIIVVDGGSNDATIDIVKQYASTKLHVCPDLNLGKSREFAFSLVETEWFLQIDSDVVLFENSGKILEEYFGRAEVVEFGTIEHYSFPFPMEEQIGTRVYNERAFFFTNLMKKDSVINKELNVRHMEEELLRRQMIKAGNNWMKTGRIIGDHYSKPMRYKGRMMISIVRTKKYPNWTFFDQGKIDYLTEAKKDRFFLTIIRIFFITLNVRGFITILCSIGNPFTAVYSYIKGYLSEKYASGNTK
ncbi:MAG: glycosyltransferase family 2 protein [Clostridiales bacterium]